MDVFLSLSMSYNVKIVYGDMDLRRSKGEHEIK